MRNDRKLVPALLRLWSLLGAARRNQFKLVLLLMIFTSFAEVLSLGAILPFIAILTSPELVFHHDMARPLVTFVGASTPQELLLPLTVIFCFAALVAGTARIVLLRANARLSFVAGSELGVEMYRRTLYQPFSVHSGLNSSAVISGVTVKANSLSKGVLLPCMNLVSSSFLIAAILATLLAINPQIAVIAFLGFGFLYALIARYTKTRILENGRQIAEQTTRTVKALQEGLGGIRDVLLDGTQEVFCRAYQEAELPRREAMASSLIITQTPRFVLEASGMVFFACLAYVLASSPTGVLSAIPVLGTVALGAQRMLPVLQLMYASLTTLRNNHASLNDVLELLDQPVSEYADAVDSPRIGFEKSVRMERVRFRYTSEGDWVLKDVSLEIPKGGSIGFCGTTGSGKSTMMDILMGLLEPTSGRLMVDDLQIDDSNVRGWQKRIAHVPQAIFLSDASLAENIAFGIPADEIDQDRVREVARKAQIADTVERWSKGYDTPVGERGVRLSGGQRQRIGIARALYKNADMIVFDEATSALDEETEAAVMQTVAELQGEITTLLIAHRVSTLQQCDRVVQLEAGTIVAQGLPSEVLRNA